MKYALNDIERIIYFLNAFNYEIVKLTKYEIHIKISESSHIYVISNSSRYNWHITEKGEGNTFGCWTHPADLISWLNDNRNTLN